MSFQFIYVIKNPQSTYLNLTEKKKDFLEKTWNFESRCTCNFEMKENPFKIKHI